MKDSIQQMEEQIQAMQEQLNQLKAQQAAMKSASTEPNHAQPAAKSEVPPTTSYPSWNTSPPPAAHQHSVYPAQTPHAHPIPPTYSWNPTPPPMPTKPKKEWDQLFAKKFMGILASGLILIGGLVLLALLAADWVKWILLTGIGSGLLAVGSIGARKQPAYLYFFHAISGLGAALLYVTILLLWKTYPTIPFPVFYGMLLLWTISLLLSIKQKNTLLPVISLIGMFFSVFIPYGFDRPTQSFMLAGLITIVSLLSIFLDTPAQRTITLLSLFFTEGSIACFLVRIWLLHTFRHTAFVSWIAAIALLTALLLTLTLWYAIRIDRPANHSTDCGLFLNLGNLILLFSGLLICMQLLKYTEAVMRPLVGTGLLLLSLLCLSASKKRDLPFQISLAGCCILHLFLLLLHASPLTLSIWVTVASCLIGYCVAISYFLHHRLPIQYGGLHFDPTTASSCRYLLLDSYCHLDAHPCRLTICCLFISNNPLETDICFTRNHSPLSPSCCDTFLLTRCRLLTPFASLTKSRRNWIHVALERHLLQRSASRQERRQHSICSVHTYGSRYFKCIPGAVSLCQHCLPVAGDWLHSHWISLEEQHHPTIWTDCNLYQSL